MPTRASLLRRPLALLVSAVIAVGSLALVPTGAAVADTAPVDPTVPETVSSDLLPTPQIDGVVWDQEVVGNVVYVAGSFTTARPYGSAAGVNTVPRYNMLAYNLTTGVLDASFAPNINGQVRSLATNPAKTKLYLGGDFSSIDGTARYRMAAFNLPSRTLDATFRPIAGSRVYSVSASATAVYAGGWFTSMSGQPRTYVAAVSPTNGAALPFNVTLDKFVRTVLASPDGSKVMIGGHFTTANGSGNPGYGLVLLDGATGGVLPTQANDRVRNGGDDSAVLSLSTDGEYVYGTGYHFGGGGNTEGTFKVDWNGNFVWIEDCHGDTYAAFANSTAVYTASHAHYCGTSGGFPQTSPTWTMQFAMAWTKDARGTIQGDTLGYPDWTGTARPDILNWWPDMLIGRYTGMNQAAWTVTATDDYVLYGGEFIAVNNRAQQGLIRFATKAIAPNTDGPRLSGANFTPNAVSFAAGQVRLAWLSNYDRDNEYLTYELRRNGTLVYSTVGRSRIWYDRPQMGYIDTGLTPGQTYSYQLRAIDPFGNVANGAATSVTVASGDLSTYAEEVVDDGASSFWRLGESGGSTVYDWAGFDDAQVVGGVTRGAAGAIGGESNAATDFAGNDQSFVASQSLREGPNTFAIEAWVKTTSTSGGKIVGFGNAKTGSSSSYDRHIFMDESGRIFFGVYPNQERRVQSASGYNDGQWHHIVASLSSGGMQLFVDGRRVAQRTDTTWAQAYQGYWRIGGDSSWAGAPYLSGTIDDVAIYPTPLTPTQVNAHYVASGRTSSLPSAPADAYGASVYHDDPTLYWRLGETSGSIARDAGVAGNDGNYQGGVTKGQSGAIAGVANQAALFDGSSGQVVAANQSSNPKVYSEELWFKTTSTSGGKLIGFGNSPSGLSSGYDRHVYLQDDGRIVFGTWLGFANTIQSQPGYNDGQWHYMVATQGAEGMRLYVDGVLVDQNGQTGSQDYDGWWRIGGDWTWNSSSPYVNGTIDEVAVYSTTLSATTVANRYALGTGVVANQPPTADFTPTVNGTSVSFDATASTDADGSIVSYAWDFGDGTTGTGPTVAHTYAPGSHTATLTVTDDDGATASTSRTVSVQAPNQAPTAAIARTVTGLSVAFDGTGSTDADGTIATYAWDFGDGTTGTGATVTHVYPATGSYTATLTVTDDDAAVGSASATFSVVAPNVGPTASFTATPTGLTAAFDATASSDPDGSVASYAWDFGDTATGTGATASHTYAAGGTYTVTLTVTDNAGAPATTTRSVTVTAPGTSTPIAQDAFGRTSGSGWGTADVGGAWTGVGSASNYTVAGGTGRIRTNAGSTPVATLNGTSSTDTDLRFSATADQASTGTGLYIVAIGRKVGSDDYRARIRLVPGGGVVLQLMRGGTSLSSTTVSGLTLAAGETVRFRLQVTGTTPTTIRAKVWKGATEPTSWQLSTTDATATLQTAGSVGVSTYLGSTATVTPVTVQFDDLIAQSTTGGPVTPPVNTPPTASFTSSASGLGLSVDGSGSSDPDGTIASYAWNFGDGGMASGATASHTYASSGTYLVTLTVTDNSGAAASSTANVTVTAPPVGVIATDAFERAITGGWGSADAGGAWTLTGAASGYSVAGGLGLQTVPVGSTFTARLGGVAATSTDSTVSFSLDKAPTGGGVYVSVLGRVVGSSDYRVRLKLLSTGVVNVSTMAGSTVLGSVNLAGVTYAAGDQLSIRLQVTGTSPTTVRTKVWRTGTAEPAAWTISSTDSTAALQAPGSIALQSYVSGSSTNAPIVTRWDNLSVAPAP